MYGNNRTLSALSFAATSVPPPKESDRPLREDVKDLGKILGESIRDHDPHVFEAVERLRKLGKKV